MKAKINITYRDKEGNIIENPTEGQRAYSPETQKLYEYKDGNWEMLKADGGLKFSAYDMNKQLVSQMENIENNEQEMIKALETLENFWDEKNDEHFMLLCNDMNYYTVFQRAYGNGLNSFKTEVIECLHNIGAIKSLELTSDGTGIEIWIQEVGEDPMVMYLFPYDCGVVKCS